MATETGRKRNAFLLFAGCILFSIAIWAFVPWLYSLQWPGNVLLAVGAINFACWLVLVRLISKS